MIDLESSKKGWAQEDKSSNLSEEIIFSGGFLNYFKRKAICTKMKRELNHWKMELTVESCYKAMSKTDKAGN